MQAGPSRRTAARAIWLGLVVGLLLAAPVARAGDAQPAPAAASAVPPADGADTPVTVVVVRHARRGCTAVFEKLIRDTFEVRNRTPGHLSTDFLRPSDPGSTAYTIIFKFDRLSHYQLWLDSAERAVWLERMAKYTEGPPQYQYHTGLEAWVTLPDEPGFRSPEKYKTVAVTWLAIFPLVLGVSSLVGPVVSGWPAAAATALTTGIVVPVLGYGVMPVMSWAFRDWLYPQEPGCTG